MPPDVIVIAPPPHADSADVTSAYASAADGKDVSFAGNASSALRRQQPQQQQRQQQQPGSQQPSSKGVTQTGDQTVGDANNSEHRCKPVDSRSSHPKTRMHTSAPAAGTPGQNKTSHGKKGSRSTDANPKHRKHGPGKKLELPAWQRALQEE